MKDAQARKLATKSRGRGMDPRELANKIISDWLKKK
jgi:hypothetical protein